MKVCILTERMKLGYGVDLAVDQQATRLAKLGFEVVVAVIHADLVQPPLAYELVVINRIMRVDEFESEASMKKILSRCKIDADVWIIETPPFYAWGQYLDGPVIFIEHGAPPGYFFNRDLGRHIDAVAEMRLNEIYGNLLPCDKIITISHSINEWLPATARSSSIVNYPGVDHLGRVPSDEARKLRYSLGVKDDECLILWVGRMQLENDEQPYKGFQELLGLVPLVQRQVARSKFLLVGRVSDGDKWKLQQQGVLVLPNQDWDGLARAYAAADLLANLSRWEGFNMPLMEAQFQGTPVVAYDLGPHPEVVRHNETGMLVKTPADFFLAVVRIASDRTLRNKFSEQAVVFAASFTWDRSIAKLAEIIRSCAAVRLSRSDTVAQRKRAMRVNRAIPRLSSHLHGTATVGDLLKLDDRAFVKTACDMLLDQRHDELSEASWLRQLRRTGDKRTVLLEMANLGELLGVKRRVSGLQASLLWTRLGVLAKQTKDRLRRLCSPRSSTWLELHDELFVMHAYRVLLGREAEPEAVSGRVAQFRQGYSRVAFLAEARFSDEGKNRPLEDPELRRLLRPYIQARQSRVRPAARWWAWREFAANFFGLGRTLPSSEWFHLENDEFVRRAYRVLLGREAEPAAVDGRVNQLLNGYSRVAILAAVRFSEEGKSRPLNDAHLRRLLFIEQLRRLPLVGWMLGKPRGAVDDEPEDLNRQIRRLDSQQRHLAAEFRRFFPSRDETTHGVQLLRTVVERIGALEAKIGAGQVERSSSLEFLAIAPSQPSVQEEFAVSAGTVELGSHHVALVAPGTILLPGALARLAQAAQTAGSDILFGDESERLEKFPFRRVRIQGPFSHETFLRRPDLGGVVAVHKDLLKQAEWQATVALTGHVVLRLVALAHTLTYLPGILAERRSADIDANLPTFGEMQSYIDCIGRHAVVSMDSAAGFDVRFPVPSAWKAVIVIVSSCNDSDLERSVVNIRAKTASEHFHLVLALSNQEPDKISEASPGVDRTQTVLNFPSDAVYGHMVNEAVRRAPSDCNLVVIMEPGVMPAESDWLERLAESAIVPDIGVVAPKTLFADGRVRHAGMALGIGDPCGYVARFARCGDLSSDSQNISLDQLKAMREVSFVSRHCMAFRRSVLCEQGGFSEDLSCEAADIEICCRLRSAGFSVRLDGRVAMIQPDSAPRWARKIPPENVAKLKARHAHMLSGSDQFWVPTPRSVNELVIDATNVRTIPLPAMQDR